MSSFHALVKFTSDTKTFFSPVKAGKDGKLEQPALGDIVIAYDSVDDLQAGANSSKQKIEKVGDSCDCFPENMTDSNASGVPCTSAIYDCADLLRWSELQVTRQRSQSLSSKAQS